MFEIGHLVLSSSPYVSVLNRTQRLTRCDFCFKKLDCDRNFTCKVCACVSYCTARCEGHDRADHESECGYMCSATSDTARLMIRVVEKMKRDETVGENMPDGSRRKMANLMDHKEHFRGNEKAKSNILRTYAQLLKCNYEYLPAFDEFSSLFGKVLINGFTVSDVLENNIATALYLAPSVLDHSCVPNASWSFKGNVLEVRTTMELENVELDNLRICYLDPLTGTRARQAALQSNYYFECQCEHCEPESEYRVFYKNICKTCNTEQTLHCKLAKCVVCDQDIDTCGDLLERVNGYINGNAVDIESATDLVEKMIESIEIKSFIFLQASKLLFTQSLHAGLSNYALKYGELCLSSYMANVQINPVGIIQTMVRVARLRNSLGLEVMDLVTQVMEIDAMYFNGYRSREYFMFIVDY